MKDAKTPKPATPATMTPPPPGAHEGERERASEIGVGLGVLIGAVFGCAAAATTVLVIALMRGGLNQPVVKLNPSFQAPRPTVVPATNAAVPAANTSVTNSPVVGPPATNTPAVPASVVTTSPADGATAVPVDANIVLTFATDMDAASLGATTVSVFDTKRGKNIAAELGFSYRQDAKQLTIALPNGVAWGSGNTIDVEVSVRAKDVAGQPLGQPFRMTFSTR